MRYYEWKSSRSKPSGHGKRVGTVNKLVREIADGTVMKRKGEGEKDPWDTGIMKFSRFLVGFGFTG